MRHRPDSSAPHLWPAKDWRQLATGDALTLFSGDDFEVGLRHFAANAEFHSERDTLCYIQAGSATFTRDTGDAIDASPDSLVHFKTGWRGSVRVSEPLDVTYAICTGTPSESTPVLRNSLTASPLKDWGAIPTMIEGVSRTAGILLSRDPDHRAESGIWTCTPGTWQCEVTSDEYCHFLDGSCTYTHESGEQIEIEPDTLAYFPKGWKGPCEVRRTMRKVYLIR